jgi:hypothetical protein
MNVTYSCPCRAAINHFNRVEVCPTVQVLALDKHLLLVFCSKDPSKLGPLLGSSSHSGQTYVIWQPPLSLH